MFRIVLLFVALAAIHAQSAQPILATNICQSDKDCNTYATSGNQFCNVTNPLDRTQNVCQTKLTTPYGSSDFTGKTTCANSFNSGGNCISYSTAGCVIPSANTTYIRCLDSIRNPALGGVCQAPNITQIVWKNYGERCDNSLTDPITRCVNGLICKNKVCQRTLLAGDNCAGTGLPCGPYNGLYGLTCDTDRCVESFSKYPGEKCHGGYACTSSVCQDGRCMETRSTPCYTNSECIASSDKVCYIPTGNTRGYCTNSAAVYRKRLMQCILASCMTETNTTSPQYLLNPASAGFTGCSTCLPQYISSMCAGYCTQGAESRAPTDGYIYNCQSNTRTVATGCEITQLVTGCDSFIPMSGSITQSISVMVVLLAGVVLTLL
jgi:hypothetical protein